MIPYHCDVLLPIEARYASPKFRRLARRLTWRRLQPLDIEELVALMEVVEMRYLKMIFQWDDVSVCMARACQRKYGNPAKIRANLAALDVQTGLALLQAIRDAGWEKGWLPRATRRALLDMRSRGVSAADIARQTGLSWDQAAGRVARRPRG